MDYYKWILKIQYNTSIPIENEVNYIIKYFKTLYQVC